MKTVWFLYPLTRPLLKVMVTDFERKVNTFLGVESGCTIRLWGCQGRFLENLVRFFGPIWYLLPVCKK